MANLDLQPFLNAEAGVLRLGDDILLQVCEQLSSEELNALRKVRVESRSRCAVPLLLAAKPGGGVRVCQDYRGLNNVTIKNISRIVISM